MRAAIAERRARELAVEPWRPVPPDGRPRSRRFAVGDPQTRLPVFLEILARHDLIGDDGRLADDVLLVSVGDHFDFGGSEERLEAARDGLCILAWLAAHPPDQVVLIAGNHDLGRVGELAEFDDASFAEAHERAVRAYRAGNPDLDLERELCADYPSLATAEVAARDFSAFTVAQRDLVWALLRARRMRLAHAAGEHMLFCHAGVTHAHLDAAGVPRAERSRARVVADALNAALDAAVDTHTGGAFAVPGLHRPGTRADGEGGGMLYHRPANPEVAQNRGHDLAAPLGRRFDPRALPRGLTQVIGHVADTKCRELLGPWARDEAPAGGALRSLVTDGRRVEYRTGLPSMPPDDDHARLDFIDGSMHRTPVERYELYPF